MATNEVPTILIVDDDRSVQRLLADALASQGFSVAVERDGEWAVDTFNKKRVDAVVLDLLLPAINGYDVARLIRATPRGAQTPIVMISGVYKSEIQQKEAVEKHGAFAFIEKPIRLSALFDALRSALGERYPSTQAPSAAPPGKPGESREPPADPQAQEEAGLVEKHSQEQPQGLGIRGDFKRRPFPEVLAEIFHWKGTGALLLRRDNVKKIVYFREGQPLSIKSNLLSECLGQVMVMERIISEAECEESTRRMKATRRRQGAILIEMGCISPHNLVYALNLQLRFKLFEVFAWEYGEYRFNPGIAPPTETVNLEMSTAAVIYEGVRRHFDVTRLRQALGDSDDFRVSRSFHPAYPLFDAGLGEEEQQLLAAIDGSKTVSDLRALELLSPLDTDRLVYALRCAGLVELKGGLKVAAPSPAERAEAVERTETTERAWSGEGLEPAARLEPAEWAESAARFEPTDRGEVAGSLDQADRAGSAARSDRAESTGRIEQGEPSESASRVESAERIDRAERVESAARFEQAERVESAASFEQADRVESAASTEGGAAAQRVELGEPTGRVESAPAAGANPPSTGPPPGTAGMEGPPAAPASSEATVSDEDIAAELHGRSGELGLAEAKFQLGEELLKEGQFQAAHRLFEEAVQIYDQAAQFHAYLGWSKFQMQPADRASAEAALDALQKAINLNPRVDKSYLFSGYIYKALGRMDQAETHFEKAIQCNPDCTEALQELKSLSDGGG